MSISHSTTKVAPNPVGSPGRQRVEPYAMTTDSNWGPTARVSTIERFDGGARVTMIDSMGRVHQSELSVIPDAEGAYKALGGWRPLAVLVVARGQVLECGVVASGDGSSRRIEVTAAQALGLAERGVHCVFRR